MRLLKRIIYLDGEWKLVVVTQASYLGELPHGGDVYCVDRIGIIPLTGGSTETIGLEVRSRKGLSQETGEWKGYVGSVVLVTKGAEVDTFHC